MEEVYLTSKVPMPTPTPTKGQTSAKTPIGPTQTITLKPDVSDEPTPGQNNNKKAAPAESPGCCG